MRKLIGIILLTAALNVNAQQGGQDPILDQKSVGLSLGTLGVGAEFHYGILSTLALRFGGNFSTAGVNNLIHISGFHSTSHITADFSNLHLMADFTPFEHVSILRVVGGIAYFIQAKGTVEIQPTDSYSYGDIMLSQDQVGKININTDWKGFAPYLGLGLIHAFPKQKFNVNLDLGTYYLKQPSAQLTGTGILAQNSTQSAQLQSNLKDYRFLPLIQLNFNYKL